MSATCDVKSCKMTFTFGPAGIPNAASAAYSGVQTREFLEQLPDGTHRTMPAFPSSIIYRDSQARIRVEHSIPPSRGVRPPFDNPWVEIQDPLAGYLYVLDPVHHIAHRVTLHPPATVIRPAFVYAAPDPALA